MIPNFDLPKEPKSRKSPAADLWRANTARLCSLVRALETLADEPKWDRQPHYPASWADLQDAANRINKLAGRNPARTNTRGDTGDAHTG